MSLEKMYIVWICAAVLFGIFEALTVQLVSVWFVIGAVAALVSSLAGAELYVQIIVFIAVSVLMLLITRPLVKKKLGQGRAYQCRQMHRQNGNRHRGYR